MSDDYCIENITSKILSKSQSELFRESQTLNVHDNGGHLWWYLSKRIINPHK